MTKTYDERCQDERQRGILQGLVDRAKSLPDDSRDSEDYAIFAQRYSTLYRNPPRLRDKMRKTFDSMHDFAYRIGDEILFVALHSLILKRRELIVSPENA